MTKICSLLLLLAFASLCLGQDKPKLQLFKDTPSFKMNGCDVKVAIGTSDYNMGRGGDSEVMVYIYTTSDAPPIEYAALQLSVADGNAKVIVPKVMKGMKKLKLEKGCQTAYFSIAVEKGQRIESIKLKWAGVEQIFLYSKGQVWNDYVF